MSKHALKRLFPAVATAVLLFVSAACAEEPIRINGTGSGLVVLRALATTYSAQKNHARFDMQKSLGSSAAIRALGKGALDIAVSGRALTPKESGENLTCLAFGRTPFVIITHKGSGVENVTAEQLAAIYNGKLTTWPSGQPIRPILRPLEDVDTKIARSISADIDRGLAALHRQGDLPIGLTDQEAFDLVHKTPGGIGTIALAMPVAEPGAVKVAKLDGVEPTLKNLSAGRYRVFKDLFIVTKKDVSPAVREFLRFVNSEKGRAVAAKAGLLPTAAKR